MSDRIPIPLAERRLDLVFVVGFSLFAMTSALFDRMAAIDVDFAHDSSPLAQALYHYGTTVDPLVVDNPLWLQVMSAISAFVFGPFYLVLVYCFVTARDWIRLPAFIYASAMLYSVIVHVILEYAGDLPPLNHAAFVGTYFAYAALPLALMFRMGKPHPFTRAPG